MYFEKTGLQLQEEVRTENGTGNDPNIGRSINS